MNDTPTAPLFPKGEKEVVSHTGKLTKWREIKGKQCC